MTNDELHELRMAAVPKPIVAMAPVYVTHARNAIITDLNGKTYIDFAAGIGVLATGHCHPKVTDAIRRQVEKFTHTCFGVVGYESYIQLAHKLNQLAPGEFEKRTFFINSGAEAVENAVKIARYYTGRRALIAFEDAFHGRTYMALTLTSQVDPYKRGFGPFASDVYRIPFAYCYRCPLCLTYPSCDCACVGFLEEAFYKHVSPEDVAALVFEPVIGEGGFIVPPPEFLQRIAALCRKHGILLVADEIQSGMGRTGRWFACEHFGVEPDLIATAKALGGGLPLSGVTGRKEILDSVHSGGLGTTFGGNPVACAAGLAVIEVIEEENLLQKAETIGERMKQRFVAMKEEFPIIGDVRGIGAMIAIELVDDQGTKKPATQFAITYRRKLFENGVISVGAGTFHNVVRVLAPLTIEDEVLERGLEIMYETMKELCR